MIRGEYMEEIIEYLCKLYFTKLEAKIYVTLIEQPALTGYQIAKHIHISRSSVYSVLDSMYQRGIILLIQGDPQVYKAENPETLMTKLKRDFIENANMVENKLKSIQSAGKEEQFINIKGYDNVITKARELLSSAEKEVYINTDFNLNIFENEWKILEKKGVRVVVFSFAALEHEGISLELYTHNRPIDEEKVPSRMMLVVDLSVTLVADAYKERPEFLGTVTSNALMVNIISEHIHNDIYLLKLRNKEGRNVVTDEIRINTLLEERG